LVSWSFETDIFSCCEPEPFEELPFEKDSEVKNLHLKAEKEKIYMYAIGASLRSKTEPVGRITKKNCKRTNISWII
jgi:hypothetical protein